MDTMQLLLYAGDRTCESWLQGGFRNLKRIVDAAESVWDGLSPRPDFQHRLRLPAPPHGAYAEHQLYVKVLLYLPLLSEQEYSRWRQLMGLGDAMRLRVSVVPFQLNVMDVPEYGIWHRHVRMLRDVLRWWESSIDPYGMLSSARQDEILVRCMQDITMPFSQYMRKHVLRDGRSPLVDCNSLFLLNLFLFTRDIEAVRINWSIVTESTYEQLHNALVSQARMRSWNQLVRRIQDGSPSITHPFELFNEVEQ
ncbi:MAG: hypothetical protein KatS3mg023_3607 [Armatimonadota bacterium]|nr:MAG: hypothetical protein KatS3mg023_3607 [Armatimonadota bacterium]